MQLEQILDRCQRLEERAAGVYRTFAASARERPEVCALWTDMAREEEQHARSMATARGHLRLRGSSRTSVDGWDEALVAVEDRLAAAERLRAGSTLAQQLEVALDLEMTELEALRHVVLDAARAPERNGQEQHAVHLANAAETLTDDPQVRLQVALLRARLRIQRS